MTRKQAAIAVRSGLNDDEQYAGCVVPPIHLSSTYNFTGFNEPVRMIIRVVATLRVMLPSARLAEPGRWRRCSINQYRGCPPFIW